MVYYAFCVTKNAFFSINSCHFNKNKLYCGFLGPEQ